VTSDERLADKYNELRSLLLNKLDLTTLTPQVDYSESVLQSVDMYVFQAFV